jgi:hypothetical protein
MAGALALLAAVMALGGAGFGQEPAHAPHDGRGVRPGPGNWWGIFRGHRDGVGRYDRETSLPLGADRTPEYNFRRSLALPPEQLFLPSYYNAYVTRGQRYIPYAGCGGEHPAGGPPRAPGDLPVHPYLEDIDSGPVVPLPTFSGRVEAWRINPGSVGLGRRSASRGKVLSRTPLIPPRSDRATTASASERVPGLMTRLWNRVTLNRSARPR